MATNFRHLSSLIGDELQIAISTQGYTAVLFVHQDGSNSDGKSWGTAFTNITGALAAASSDANDHTLILIAPGSYDINITGDPTYDVNVSLKGIDRYNIIFTNSHASATSILKFENCTVNMEFIGWNCGTGNHGIILDNCDGSFFTDVTGLGDSLTSAKTVLNVQNTTYFYMHSSVFAGDIGITHATVFKLDGSARSKITDSRFWFGLKCVELIGTGSYNYFEKNHALDGATGITIGANQTNNKFHNFHLVNNTINVTDGGTGNLLDKSSVFSDKSVSRMLPETSSTGIVVTSKNIIDTYADNYTQLDSGATFTKPFKVVGIGFTDPSDNTAKYIIKLGYGGAGSEVDFFRIGFQEGKFGAGGAIAIDGDWLPAGTRIAANCMTENAVADSLDVYLFYEEL